MGDWERLLSLQRKLVNGGWGYLSKILEQRWLGFSLRLAGIRFDEEPLWDAFVMADSSLWQVLTFSADSAFQPCLDGVATRLWQGTAVTSAEMSRR